MRTELFSVALRNGSDKYVLYPAHLRPSDPNGTAALFDLAADRGERNSLWEARSSDQAAWGRFVERLQTRFPTSDPPERAASDAEIRAQLNTLGYAGND